jgi:PAS domain S-box-containing protein
MMDSVIPTQFERKFLDSEKWSQTVIENAHSAFIGMNGEGIIMDWNRAAERTFGWRQDEVKGKRFSQTLLPERLRKTFETEARKFKESGTSLFFNQILDQYAVHKDGHEMPVEVTYSCVHLNDSFRLFAFIRDSLRRHELELQRHRTEELERANRDLNRFAHLASHELQEPLRTISIYAELLEECLRPKIEPIEREMLLNILKSSKRMSQLVEELLYFARIGSEDRASLHKVDSAAVFQEAVEDVRVLIESRGAILVLAQLPPVLADPKQLRMVFENLLLNSLTYCRGCRPEIAVSASRIGEFWKFTIQDNGMGFDMKYSKTIFEMFKRIDPNDRNPGSGAGLAICKKIINLHGGRIWAESAVGQGSRFYFTLPAAEPYESQGSLAGMRILVVTDQSESRALLRSFLNGTGASVEFVGGAFQALERCRTQRYDLVLVDIEARIDTPAYPFRQIHEEGRCTPVMALTNSNAQDIQSTVFPKTFDGVLLKSMSPQEFLGCLQSVYPPPN